MKEYNLEVTLYVTVKSDLNSYEEVIDEFSREADYNISNSDNVKVVATEWIDISLV